MIGRRSWALTTNAVVTINSYPFTNSWTPGEPADSSRSWRPACRLRQIQAEYTDATSARAEMLVAIRPQMPVAVWFRVRLWRQTSPNRCRERKGNRFNGVVAESAHGRWVSAPHDIPQRRDLYLDLILSLSKDEGGRVEPWCHDLVVRQAHHEVYWPNEVL